MGWYDVFANFYDNSLEALYAEQRIAAADALDLAPGQLVLDVPCGTGQSFDAIAPRILPGGTLLGVDFSTGMLARAEARARRLHFDHVRVLHADVHRSMPVRSKGRVVVRRMSTARRSSSG